MFISRKLIHNNTLGANFHRDDLYGSHWEMPKLASKPITTDPIGVVFMSHS
ncbi:hypothetical protein CA54_20590 [Symmachiella macrocystis]|uniref:Uncharacterized protein n=1 Tax=Symmachiella macrocystis TaxID=2527985 RepID=A0A5C6BNB2_9PLAN|nr:hypothetical protein CA54_20590 [Symmachiella macrocystis]